jgi:H+/Cl- antiporter ClcA
MLAVIIAGVSTQALSGNYLYFGRPADVKAPLLLIVPEGVVIGLLGGLMGGLFALVLSNPKFSRLPEHWLLRALTTGILCSAIGYATSGRTSGSGYESTKQMLEGSDGSLWLFPFCKIITTSLSYLSGMAGGIFSPCLTIGAGLGLMVAQLGHLENFKTCALIGMVAFFSGAIRAPLTGVIIVMEMTDEHLLILPFMIAGYLANAVGRRLMPVPLYRRLAERYLAPDRHRIPEAGSPETAPAR